jgi:Flp pilus assembly pilin Flp
MYLHHNRPHLTQAGAQMALLLSKLWSDDQGQDVAEYAVTLAIILVIVVGTVGVIHSHTNVALWSSASSVQ